MQKVHSYNMVSTHLVTFVAAVGPPAALERTLGKLQSSVPPFTCLGVFNVAIHGQSDNRDPQVLLGSSIIISS